MTDRRIEGALHVITGTPNLAAGIGSDLVRLLDRANSILAKYKFPVDLPREVRTDGVSITFFDQRIDQLLRDKLGNASSADMPIDLMVAMTAKAAAEVVRREVTDHPELEVLAHHCVLLGLQSAALGIQIRDGAAINSGRASIEQHRSNLETANRKRAAAADELAKKQFNDWRRNPRRSSALENLPVQKQLKKYVTVANPGDRQHRRLRRMLQSGDLE